MMHHGFLFLALVGIPWLVGMIAIGRPVIGLIRSIASGETTGTGIPWGPG